MRVLVLGGYGEFGGRLARLLLRDGHEVLVAGRSAAAAGRFCAARGGMPVVLDRDRDLARIPGLAPDAVVDAAGPFQSYRDDPYRVARAALAARAHYLDLSDDGDFTAGIAALDGAARAAGRFALSGVSSTPALSSAAVASLREGLGAITVIESAILPGARAPRGRSVMSAVLGQAGGPLRLWRGGQWCAAVAWSRARRVLLAPGLSRHASLFLAPDLVLFPGHFGARSVLFRAGLEPAVMQHGLTVLAALRSRGLLPDLRRLRAPLHLLAGWLGPLGSDRGAMIVDVTGPARSDGEPVTRRWTLLAEPGQGPYVPAIPARAILRRPGAVRPGARPCLAELPLAAFEEAMADVGVRLHTGTFARPPVFRVALGEAWDRLPAAARRAHSVQDRESFSGRAEVVRGTSWLARFAGAVFRFPDAGTDVPLTVIKTRTGRGELWERNFDGRRFRSHLTPAGPGRCIERFWVFCFELELPVSDGLMHLPVRRGWVLGLPIPRRWLPGSDSFERADGDGIRFDVSLLAPFGAGLIVRYRGWVRPDAQPC